MIHEIEVGQVPDIFFHGTKKETWEIIQAEGVLWGCPWLKYDPHGPPRNRYTYLAPDVQYASGCGNIVLEVKYTPGSLKDNYNFDPPPGLFCWQFSVFEPIPVECVRPLEGIEIAILYEIQTQFLDENFSENKKQKKVLTNPIPKV
jgi:hypothetical protein